MMRQGLSGLMDTSPVRSPTENFLEKSRNFWFEMVLMGDV